MKIKIKLTELLFYSSFFIWLLVNFIVQTSFINKYQGLYRIRLLGMIICVLILFGKFLLEKTTLNNLLYMSSMMGLAIIVGISTHKLFDALSVVSTIALIISINNIRFKSTMIFWLASIAIFMLGVYICWKVGFIENILRYQAGRGVRFGLGYQYPTFGANYLFHFTIFYLYIRNKRITLLESLFLGGLNYYFYINTDTKSAFYLAILTLVLVYLLKNKNVNQKILSITRNCILTLGFLIPIVLTYLYDPSNGLFIKLNHVLTGRLSLGKQTISNFGVHLFGQRIDWVLQQSTTSVFDEYLYVDSSFVNILVHYGVVLLAVLYFSYYKIFKNKNFDTVETIVIVILILHSMFDPQFFEMMYNPMLLMIGYIGIVGNEECQIQSDIVKKIDNIS